MYVWRNIQARSLGCKSNKYYIFWVSVCSLRYPARNAHAPYCHVSPFSTLCHKRHDFREKVIQHKMCVLILSTTFVWNISHSEQIWTRYDHKCISVFMYSTGYSCQILMKLEFSRQIFQKYSNIKFHLNPSSGSRVPRGRTDRHDESNSRFSQFCDCA
jgi:hypothetical protein